MGQQIDGFVVEPMRPTKTYLRLPIHERINYRAGFWASQAMTHITRTAFNKRVKEMAANITTNNVLLGAMMRQA